MSQVWFITGTDTGVGKTVLAALVVRYLRSQGSLVRAVKPFCSGGRGDAEILFRAQAGDVPLNQINPWHFPTPLTPWVAARKAKRPVSLAETLAFLRAARNGTEELVIEGAGGLLSPLGMGFSARELIVALRATPLVVCPNRLGAINQARLVFAALPPQTAARGRLVLMAPAQPDLASRSNPGLLATWFGSDRVHVLPWLPKGAEAPLQRRLRDRLSRLLR